MHVGSAYCGHIPPYPEIRIDSFADSAASPFPPAKLYLLTHTHSDHIQGLDAKSFGQPVVCSEDAKRMLILGERVADRIAFDKGDISERKKPWGHLKTRARRGDQSSISRDLLAEATTALVQLMAFLPFDTKFFINTWTWGYEDILRAISRAFGNQIHVDRYKYTIFKSLANDSLLGSIVTRDPNATRFHACERFNRCDCVACDDENVVYINPVTCGVKDWRNWAAGVLPKLKAGERVNYLMVPVSRHSSLPELQRLVSLFRPNRVVPNTMYENPDIEGLD
ncbi:hypothetical protein BOTBODRAFT_84904, partial [Botryobasidium botryosum FD-172 SS1]